MKTLKTTYYKELLDRFNTFIEATKSLKSGNYYTGNIRDFFLYLESNQILDINQVDETVMRDYFGVLATRKKQRGKGTLSERTINCNLSTLRMFSLRMQTTGVLKRGLPVPNNFYSPQHSLSSPFALKREIVTTDEIKLIYSFCNSSMEQSLIALAYGCGLRRGALVGLKESHIDFQKGIVTVINGKNNKTRHVPISDFFITPLRNYTIERLQILSNAQRVTDSFFLNETGKPISGDQLNKTLKKIILRTNHKELIDKNITLHCLRHSIATHLMDAGQSYEYVRSFLGHSIVDTTTIYAKKRKIKNYYTL